MTFPTKADIAFFKKAKRIQELWEPKFGDWFLYVDEEPKIVDEELFVIMRGFGYTDEHIWLPRPDQLWEILEEKGIDWKLSGSLAKIRLPGQGWAEKDLIVHHATTPSIALGRALIEVLKEE